MTRMSDLPRRRPARMSCALALCLVAATVQAKDGADVDATAMMREVTPEQLSSCLTFLNDPNYVPLRKQVGLGASLASQLMLKAVGTRNIPMSDLL